MALKTYHWQCSCGREMTHEKKPLPGQLCFACEETTMTTPNHDQIMGLTTGNFATLVQKHARLTKALKELKDAKDGLATKILERLEDSKVDSCMVDKLKVTRVKGRKSSKLMPKLLLENGVTADIIKRSTVESQGNPYVKVTDTDVEAD